MKLLRGEPPTREDFEMWKDEILIEKHGNLANAQEASRYGGSSLHMDDDADHASDDDKLYGMQRLTKKTVKKYLLMM